MKRFCVWAIAASGLLGLSSATAFAQDNAKPDGNELFSKLDKNGDGKLVPDEIPEEQGRFFDRLVRLGDKDDNGELTKAEFQAALERSDRPVQGGGFGDRRPGGPGGAGAGPLVNPKEMIERLDKNKDGKLSKDEIPDEGPARFLRMMLERSGKEALTADDIERARAASPFAGGLPGAQGGRFEPGEFLKRMDKNGDGKLQKDELPEGMRERFGRVFEKLGKNELTGDEFGKAMAEFGGPAGPGGFGRPNPEEMFKRMDTNGDGKITLDEIPEQGRDRAKPMFDRAKKDVLTLDDVRAFIAERGPEGPGAQGQPRRGGEQAQADELAQAQRRQEGDRRPEPRREGGQPPAGDRPREGADRPREGGDRPREGGDRPREGGGRPREGADRPREGDLRPDAPRDGDRRPDARPDAPRDGDRRPDGPGPGQQRRPRFFELLDSNRDGRISRDELSQIQKIFEQLDGNKDGHLDPAELLGGPLEGGRPPFVGGPDRRSGAPPQGDRPREGDRPRDGDRRPEPNRPDANRPDAPRRDGDRRPEAGRPDAPRRDGDRRPEADRPRDGERRPGGDRPRDGESKA